MNAIEIHQKLQEAFGEAIGPLSEPKIDAFAVVKASRIVEVCAWLKAAPGIEMDFLEDLTAVDWPKRNVIEVVYHLQSFPHRHGIVLKVEADRADPVVDTVECVWKAANWLEREVYDLFGVGFSGHPDLRRILMWDEFKDHPMRKDYVEPDDYEWEPTAHDEVLDRAKAHAAAAAPALAAPPPAEAPKP